MTGSRDEQMIEFVQNSMKRGIPLHQLEDYLDCLENVRRSELTDNKIPNPIGKKGGWGQAPSIATFWGLEDSTPGTRVS